MATDALSVLTLLTNFLCMALSLWFAIYLLARSQANHLTFRAVAGLLALAFYFNSAFTEMVNPSQDTGIVRSLATTIALVAAHDLTHYLLPQPYRKKYYWAARGIVLFSIVVLILHFYLPPGEGCDPRYNCVVDITSPWIVVDLYKFLVYAAILSNLWLIKRYGGKLQNRSFYIAVLLAASTIGYGFLGVLLNRDLPRFVSNLLVLSAMILLAYSVVRHRALVTRRTTFYDLPITLLTIIAITTIYILVAWQAGLPPASILLLAVLAVFTHSAYDFVRESLDRLFRSQERQTRSQLRDLERDASKALSLHRYLRRGLAILCHNLKASSGFIAVRQGNQYEVVASLHSLPIGTHFPPREVTLEEIAQPTHVLMQHTAWLAPAFAGGEQVAVVGIGERKDHMTYGDEDLCWLEDIADEFGDTVYTHKVRLELAALRSGDFLEQEPTHGQDTTELLSTLALRPDPELVKCIEEGFRNIHDYSKLGRSPLVSMFDIQSQDHIECGKLVQARLIQILEKLRPHGEPPSEPIPREWYSYTILHDAYVKDKPARDIMSKLYISEGTYYRTRRKALRGVTRALMEMEAVA